MKSRRGPVVGRTAHTGVLAAFGFLALAAMAQGQFEGTPFPADPMAASLEPETQAVIPAWSFRELTPAPARANPPLPDPGIYPVQLVLDDDDAEGTFGVGGAAARQFLWFQRFSPLASDFDLEEVWILFPPDPQVTPGAAVQVVVYQDADRDPTTGAELLFAMDDVIQAADGSTFSVYPLTAPVAIRGGGDVLVGVVNRYVESGVTPLHQPAALDTTASQMRSWVATWTGDPPETPVFPPDQSLFLIDDLVGGNWMIRAFGTSPDAVAVPTLGTWSLALLAFLLLAAALRRLRHRPPLQTNR